MIERDELAAWLQLLEAPRVGRETARKLLAAFGSPQGVLAAAPAARREVAGAAAGVALSAPPPSLADLVDQTIDWLRSGPSRHVVTLGDAHYPRTLLETADPPLLLYTEGRLELLGQPTIAIVGSRHATRQGLDNAHAFAAQLGEAGFTIVSGLALGIDGAAHEGALGTQGSTIAVVGTGLDLPYPLRHKKLAERISDKGIIVSEYSLGTPPLAANFPQRNRLIAGMSVATLVVEAAPQSGSLITARLANEAGREVLAIPGSIHSPQSRGCHALIKQGAKLVESVQDILDELRPVGSRPSPARGGASFDAARPGASEEPRRTSDAHEDETDPLLAALGFDPVALDTLAERTGWPPAVLNTRLLALELDGRVARLPGQRFQRRGRA